MGATCEIPQIKNKVGKARQTLEDIRVFMEGRLNDLGFEGLFYLDASSATPGSPHLKEKGVNFRRGDGMFTIQLGSNDTAWKLRMRTPPTVSIGRVIQEFERRAKADRSSDTADKKTRRTPKASALADKRLIKLLSDAETLNKDFAELFEHPGTAINQERVIAHFDNLMQADHDQITLFIETLVKRKFLEKEQRGDTMYLRIPQKTAASAIQPSQPVAVTAGPTHARVQTQPDAEGGINRKPSSRGSSSRLITSLSARSPTRSSLLNGSASAAPAPAKPAREIPGPHPSHRAADTGSEKSPEPAAKAEERKAPASVPQTASGASDHLAALNARKSTLSAMLSELESKVSDIRGKLTELESVMREAQDLEAQESALRKRREELEAQLRRI